jgi:predicted amidohydrolase
MTPAAKTPAAKTPTAKTPAAGTPAAETATIGIAQWLPIPGEMERNEQTARVAVADLAARGADLVVLPEMWLTGYDPGRLAEHSRRAAEPLDGPLVTRLRTWARDQSVMVCAGTIPELAGSDVYNTAVLIDADGEVLTAHRKVHLYRPGGEHIAFAAGSSLRVVQTSRLGRVGVLVCFDGDFCESARTLALEGAGLVILPSAYETAAERWWDLLYPAQALGNAQWWVMANQCGDNGSIEFLGGSRVIAPDGEIVASLPRAGSGGVEYLVTEIKLARRLQAARQEAGILLTDRRADVYQL